MRVCQTVQNIYNGACNRAKSPAAQWSRSGCYTGRVDRFHVENFGCRTSQSDGDAISAQLECLGAGPAVNPWHADVIVVNTCTVTAEADRDARAYIRRVQRQNPRVHIVVTGCYAQRAPQEVAALPGVFAVVGNSHKQQVAEIALQRRENTANPTRPGFVPLASVVSAPVRPFAETPGMPTNILADDIFAHTDFHLPSLPASVVGRLSSPAAHRTRPSLKIQDGCGNRCTFCVIPSTRGNSRSLSRDKVLNAIREFVSAGGKELVLTGINLGRWGRDLAPQSRFEDLLAEIFETTTLPRLRISSVEPMDWSENMNLLLRRWSIGPHPRLARHVHLPLQSGSDAILRRMHRRYRPWHYAERLAAVRSASPHAAIGADVMVGFPGETDREFQENLDFIAAQPFTYLHLFPFSARPGTPGWDLHRQHPVPGSAVQQRMAALRALIEQKNRTFRAGFVHHELSVLTLISTREQSASPQTSALSDNFLPVELEGAWPPNTLLTAQISAVSPLGLQGTVVAESAIATSRPPRTSLQSKLKCYTHDASTSLAHLEAAHR